MQAMSKEQLIVLMEDIKNVEFKLNYKNIFDTDIVQSERYKTITLENPEIFYKVSANVNGIVYDTNSNTLEGGYVYNEIVWK